MCTRSSICHEKKKRKRKYKLQYTRNEYLSTRSIYPNSFKIPVSSPIFRSHYRLNSVPHFTFHLNSSKFLSFIFSHPPFISLSMKLFTTMISPLLPPKTQFNPLNSVTPSIQSNSCQRIHRTRAHENQSTIRSQLRSNQDLQLTILD